MTIESSETVMAGAVACGYDGRQNLYWCRDYDSAEYDDVVCSQYTNE